MDTNLPMFFFGFLTFFFLFFWKGGSLSPKALPPNKFFPLISAADAKAANASADDA